MTSSWPPLPPDPGKALELEKKLFEGQVAEAQAENARRWQTANRNQDREWAAANRAEDREWKVDDRGDDEDMALRKLAIEAEYDRSKAIHDARIEIAKGAVERAHGAAEFVRNAAAGVLAIYEVVLGVRFVADKAPLPPSGLLPALFLGIALIGATLYVAMVGPSSEVPAPVPTADARAYQERRLNTFVDWVSKVALARVGALHGAAFALALGVVFMPAPFVGVDAATAVLAGVVGLALVVLLPRATT
jgi:hypothetical protein